METGEPSRTAIMAATARGLHRLEAATPWVFDDFLALVLVGPSWPEVRAELVAAVSEPLFRATSTMTVTRARYTEDRLAAGRFDQYVLLGAGLDTFAWRRPDALAAGLRVFEVDHPASQAWKLARVEELGLPAIVELMTHRTKGLILITGSTSQGKTTTMAVFSLTDSLETATITPRYAFSLRIYSCSKSSHRRSLIHRPPGRSRR